MNGRISYADALKSLPRTRLLEKVEQGPVRQTDWPTVELAAEPYLPSEDLVRVTDLALTLGRPLLLQGEPGCGKTRLAHSVAYALGTPLETAYIKSTSRAQDLIYTYDAVRRLYDAQMGPYGPTGGHGESLARSAANYVGLGPLGRAIARAQYGRASTVLIDEIDKADLDFPNDLLWELDRMEFEVTEAPEIGYKAGGLRPLVIITHNEEKPLPPAFLRRCVYYYVEFPQTPSELDAILRLHNLNSPLSGRAIEIIGKLRAMDLTKQPGLSELLDWVRYEEYAGTTPSELAMLPDLEAILKDRGDQQRARKQAPMS
ncbi:MoxR family ATPase [Actinoplanes sp. NPDC049118]|uniref:AAA family ATPase n=1 Tax=Actinoplanes sp. NPDC049118 TaxID=3155769 RepID=UPI0033EE705B